MPPRAPRPWDAAVLAVALALVGYVIAWLLPQYRAIALGPPPGQAMWFPEIARADLLARAGRFVCVSTGACVLEALRFRAPDGRWARAALAAAAAGIALNGYCWARYGGGMALGVAWDLGFR